MPSLVQLIFSIRKEASTAPIIGRVSCDMAIITSLAGLNVLLHKDEIIFEFILFNSRVLRVV
jgi:hypothetical protein